MEANVLGAICFFAKCWRPIPRFSASCSDRAISRKTLSWPCLPRELRSRPVCRPPSVTCRLYMYLQAVNRISIFPYAMALNMPIFTAPISGKHALLTVSRDLANFVLASAFNNTTDLKVWQGWYNDALMSLVSSRKLRWHLALAVSTEPTS
jgi:hypothetical protein